MAVCVVPFIMTCNRTVQVALAANSFTFRKNIGRTTRRTCYAYGASSRAHTEPSVMSADKNKDPMPDATVDLYCWTLLILIISISMLTTYFVAWSLIECYNSCKAMIKLVGAASTS